MSFRGEETLVGLVALALLPLIGLRIWRGLRDGRLPVYRTYLERTGSAAKFNLLLALHAIAFLLIALVTADLLIGLGLREAL
ncbi:MAG TPA: hypothetical protein VLK25_10370 [Allosphingosinicella sp.]|nr:hypothetical protein [Allosphingosinicella sp.]